MLVSPSKSKAILRCTGPGAEQIRRKYTRKTPTGRILRIRSAKRCIDIPLVDSFTYLGAVVSYDHFEDRTLAYRMEVGSGNFGRLTRVLRGRHALSVNPSYAYGRHASTQPRFTGLMPVDLHQRGSKNSPRSLSAKFGS